MSCMYTRCFKVLTVYMEFSNNTALFYNFIVIFQYTTIDNNILLIQ